jgi:hypothetical protein
MTFQRDRCRSPPQPLSCSSSHAYSRRSTPRESTRGGHASRRSSGVPSTSRRFCGERQRDPRPGAPGRRLRASRLPSTLTSRWFMWTPLRTRRRASRRGPTRRGASTLPTGNLARRRSLPSENRQPGRELLSRRRMVLAHAIPMCSDESRLHHWVPRIVSVRAASRCARGGMAMAFLGPCSSRAVGTSPFVLVGGTEHGTSLWHPPSTRRRT